jgi:cephalosporin hydroxylase
VGHGQVISVDVEQAEGLPAHPRLRFLTGQPHDEAVVGNVREIIGADPAGARALVVLGSRAHRHDTTLQFEAYAPLVPVGSYVVVTDTVVNGHPVWPAFGPGPTEALKQILTRHGEFVPDPAMVKYSLTFNPGGFLRRVG